MSVSTTFSVNKSINAAGGDQRRKKMRKLHHVSIIPAEIGFEPCKEILERLPLRSQSFVILHKTWRKARRHSYPKRFRAFLTSWRLGVTTALFAGVSTHEKDLRNRFIIHFRIIGSANLRRRFKLRFRSEVSVVRRRRVFTILALERRWRGVRPKPYLVRFAYVHRSGHFRKSLGDRCFKTELAQVVLTANGSG